MGALAASTYMLQISLGSVNSPLLITFMKQRQEGNKGFARAAQKFEMNSIYVGHDEPPNTYSAELPGVSQHLP